jgi:hypothetical protein
LTIGAIDSDLGSLANGASLNGINCARFDLRTGFARNLRVNSADDDVRRGDESLEAKMLMKIGFLFS